MYHKKIILSLIVIVYSFSSCKKKVNMDFAEAEINGESWQTGGHHTGITDFPNNKFSILLSAGRYIKADDYFITSSLINVLQIPKTMGKHYLVQVPFSDYVTKVEEDEAPFALFSTLWQDGEQPCAGYMIDSTDSLNNWISIDQQKNDFERVWGTFSMTLIRDTSYVEVPCYRNPYGDTIKIRNGRFYVTKNKS